MEFFLQEKSLFEKVFQKSPEGLPPVETRPHFRLVLLQNTTQLHNPRKRKKIQDLALPSLPVIFSRTHSPVLIPPSSPQNSAFLPSSLSPTLKLSSILVAPLPPLFLASHHSFRKIGRSREERKRKGWTRSHPTTTNATTPEKRCSPKKERDLPNRRRDEQSY